MARVDLTYNPYLPQTSVRLNGMKPGMNSPLEVYEHKILREWVAKLPDLLEAEMNGFDFDLYLTGTQPDYEDICHAFEKRNLSIEDVRLFLDQKIEDPQTKSARIDGMLQWIQKNPIEDFDSFDFYQKNRELFEDPYPLDVIGPTPVIFDEPDVQTEHVEHAADLRQTSLEQVPLLLWTDKEHMPLFRENLQQLIDRRDVQDEQLFFLFAQDVDTPYLTRIIQDMGVSRPQVIQDSSDDKIKTYIRSFMVTDHVRKAIDLFQDVRKEMEDKLQVHTRKFDQTSSRASQRIENCEQKLLLLEQGDSQMKASIHPGSITDMAMWKARDQLLQKIQRWRSGKLRAVGRQEGAKAASAMAADCQRYYEDFRAEVLNLYVEEKNTLRLQAQRILEHAAPDLQNFPEVRPSVLQGSNGIPLRAEDLIDLYEIQSVAPRQNFMDMWNKQPARNQGDTLHHVYTYSIWRGKAAREYEDAADTLITEIQYVLRKYATELQNQSTLLLERLQSQVKHDRSILHNSLSEEEQVYGTKRAWLDAYARLLRDVEEK